MISNRYARALADVIIARGETNAVSDELHQYAAMIAGHNELREMFANPVIPMDRKQAVLNALVERKPLRETSINFLRLLLANQRLHQLDRVLKSLERELNSRAGILAADVTTARPVSDMQRDQLQNRLAGMTGQEVRLKFDVDPEIIGGVVTRLGSVVYDGSIKSQLERMKEELARG
jgi:F-type H+-transporting ATPase subunit delta